MNDVQISPFQENVLAVPEENDVVLAGGRGGGKTFSILLLIFRYAEQYGENAKVLYVRKSYAGLLDFEALTRQFFGAVYGSAAKYNSQENIWRLPNGAIVELGQFEDVKTFQKFQGRQFSMIVVDELGQYLTAEASDLLSSCLRSSARVPLRRVYAANPAGQGHGWIKQRYIDASTPWEPFREPTTGRMTVVAPSTYTDNIFIDSEEYRSSLEASTGTRPELRKAWIGGDWNIIAGSMFSDLWTPSKHILAPFRIPSSWRVDRCFDWGSSKPYACLWIAESDGCAVEIAPGVIKTFPKGTLLTVSELYGWNGRPNEGTRQLAGEIARKIVEIESRLPFKVHPGPADTSIWDAENGNCIADDMARQGVSWTRANKGPGSRVQGWQRLRSMLAASLETPMEEPGLFIFENCRHLIRTLPSAPCDEVRMDDIDSASEDHLLDSLRYRALTPTNRITPFALFG